MADDRSLPPPIEDRDRRLRLRNPGATGKHLAEMGLAELSRQLATAGIRWVQFAAPVPPIVGDPHREPSE